MSSWLTFDFSPAGVKAPSAMSQLSAPQRRAREMRVGWLLPNLDVNSASTRYRCFHIARVLAQWGVEHSFFTDPDVAAGSLRQVDALIIVKRLEPEIIGLIANANERNTPVFIDLCDDLLHERLPRNVGGVHGMVFTGIAPLLAGVITPTLTMAQRVRAHAGSVNVPIRVIPDIAETEDLFYKTAEFASGTPLVRPAAPSSSAKERKSVVWFGNHGATHSNFGIASLLPAMRGLRKVHDEIPLELVLVSNSATTIDSVIRPFGVPTRYVQWSPETVYAELKRADAALLTTGDDDFSLTKSANRVLQALSAGVPVVSLGVAGQAISDTELAAFSDCILIGSKRGLLAYLGPDREKNVSAALTAAEKILARYSPEKVAQIWLELLVRSVAERRPTSLSRSGGRIVLVLETGDSLQDLEAVVTVCREQRRELELVASLKAVKARPKLLDICARQLLAPTVVEDAKAVCPHRLYGVERIVVEDERGKVATTIRQWTKSRHWSVEICTLARFREELDASVSGGTLDAPALAADSARNPGPFSERREPDGSAAWVFVVHENAKGWILDGICREIGSRQPDSWHVAYRPPELPPARNYWFSHHSLFLKYFRSEPERLAQSRTFIWYTHPRDESAQSIAESLDAFDHATQVVFTCAANRDLWLKRGLSPERARVVLGGADPELFLGHERGDGVVGLSSSFYERKNPDRLLELMRLLPHRRFHLIGRKWEQYALFEAMRALPNFFYLTIPYQQYPAEYRKFDVFLSMSTLEGGPIPLLEAMMCNAVPVASDTGFAPDLIRHGENGFLFDIDAPAQTIAWQIEAAFQLKCDVRSTVLPYDWNNFSKSIMGLGG
jgi:glycosyltransferase involved in cell wall biosynthesis